MSDVVQLTVTKARPQLWVSTAPQVVYLHTIAQMTVTQRPLTPLNLCLALDRSSSMRGERLYQVKEAARQVVNQLGPRDAFALIAFNDRAEVIVPACTGADHTALHVAISSLEARGGTEMAQGLSLGLREIERPRLAGLNRLILPRCSPEQQSIAKLELRYETMGAKPTQFVTNVSVDALAQEEPALTVEPSVRQVLERVTAYRLQAQAWEAVAKGRVAEATQTLQQAGMHLFNAGEIELAQMVHVEATRLLQNGSASTDGRKRIKYGTRGLIAGGKHADL